MLKTLAAAAAFSLAVAGPALAQVAKDGWFTASDGVRLHYLTVGDQGSPVILLHGFRGTAEANWFAPGIAQALSKTHRVFALDQRGHGQSQRPGDPAFYGQGRMSADVVELMDHLKIGKAHIGGYSMGGAVTAAVMARAPDRFLTASFGGSGVAETDPALQKKAAARDPRGDDPAGRELAGRFTLPSAAHSDPAFRALQEARSAEGDPALDLTTIAFPVIAINGEFDRPHSKTQRMKRELKSFESVILPARSHATALWHPVYRTTLVRFMAANDAE